MLKKLRHKKTAKWIFFLLLILILPAFVFWGFGSYVRDKTARAAHARLFGRDVPESEYQDALEATRTQLILQFGEKADEAAKHLRIENMALERLVLLGEAKKRHIRVTDKEVVDAIESYPIFQINGQFNDKYYLETLQYVFHLQPRSFEEQVRQNLILSKLYEQITAGVKLTPQETWEEYRKANEEISVYYLASRAADFAKDVQPAEKELREYFAKNRLRFKIPLSFNLEYAAIGTGDSDDAVRQKIQKLLPRLRKGEDIATVSKEFNAEPKETGFFSLPGAIPALGWSPELAIIIPKAKPGQYLPPVKIGNDFYLLKLKERKEAHLPDFEEVKDRVRAIFVRETAYQAARARIAECQAKLKEWGNAERLPAAFEKAAKLFGLRSSATQPFRYSSYIEGIGSSDIFWKTAEGLKENESSEIIENPAGFYLISLKSRTPVSPDKFSAEKEEFSQQLLTQKKQEAYATFLQELAKIHQTD